MIGDQTARTAHWALADRAASPGEDRAALIEIAGVALVADASGALFLPAERTLIVADLHLEKASSHARRRQFLPPYDSGATLARLAKVVAAFAPRAIVALGDSFHDRRAAARLGAGERELLRTLQAGRDWIWVAGNHDPDPPAGCGGETAPEFRAGGLALRHEPSVHEAGLEQGEIAGHLHPIVRVLTRSGSVRRRCFLTDPVRCIMPAFGAFAGGLNFRDPAFPRIFGSHAVTAFVLGREGVHAVPQSHCVPEPRGFVPL